MNLKTYLEVHSPTQKQLDFIRSIEQSSSVKFTGKTKQEASKFINEYKIYTYNAKLTNKEEQYVEEENTSIYFCGGCEIDENEYDIPNGDDGWGGSRFNG